MRSGNHLTSCRLLICLRDATFRLGERLVFEHTNWVLRKGEQWAIVGPNGAGKSLFADAIRGQLPLVQGELLYHLNPPAGLSPEETIGHVSFEDRTHDLPGFLVQSRWSSLEEEASLSVASFLSYEQVMDVNPFEVTEVHARRKPAFERRRKHAVKLLGISSLLNRSVISLSNGERQKVQLARALCHSFRLLILDDPFAGLDTAARTTFHRVLNSLAETGLPCLIITPRAEDLPRMVNRILEVEHCRVVAAGPRRDVLGQRPYQAGKGSVRQAGSADGIGYSQAATATSLALPGLSRHAPMEKDLKGQRLRKPRELVRLRNVTVRYGPAIVVKDLSWTVFQGESWALLGPNGSGKTTLLSLIQGDHPQAYSNDIRVMGRSPGVGHSVWSIRRQIGVLSPELHACFEMNQTALAAVVSGFFDTPAVFETVSRGRVRAAEAVLRRFGLGAAAAEPLGSLSAGLQRLVLLARALVKRPPLLLLDEPCQGLDPDHRRRFLAIIEPMIRNGLVTVIYVTHRKDEIPASIRNTMVLRNATMEKESHAKVAKAAKKGKMVGAVRFELRTAECG